MVEPIKLKEMDKKQFKQWQESYDTILTDCDGVLWHDDVAIPQAPYIINNLKSLGKNIYFVTNNGTKTRHDIWLKAMKLNFKIDESNIIAPTYSIAEYLKQNLATGEKVYVIGSPALAQELKDEDIHNFGIGEDLVSGEWINMLDNIKREISNEKVGAIVVGFDEHFSFTKMLKASNILDYNRKCLFLATNADEVHRYPNACIPGTGAIVKALETCLGRKAQIMGKPNPLICENLIRTGVIDSNRTLMIGDCVKTDVFFGKNCGFHTLLVGTGNYNWSKVEELLKSNYNDFVPDFYIDSLGDLINF